MSVLEYSREAKRKRWTLLSVAGGMVAVLVFYGGYGFWKNATMRPNSPCRTKILVIDAVTGAQLNPTIRGPTIRGRDPWRTTFTGLPDGQEINWIYTDKPLPIGVSAPGYQEVELLLTPNSPQAVTVHLKR